jgi:hypothetical protein
MTTIAIQRIVVFAAQPEAREGRGEGAMSDEEGLIAGFLSGKPAAEAAFIAMYQGKIRAEVYSNCPSLVPYMRDIQQSATLRLCEMRASPSGVKRICPPVSEVVKFTVAAPARVLKRMLKRTKETEPLKDDDAIGPSNTEASVELKRLLEIALTLPGSLRKTLLARMAHEMGDGPPLPEALGIDRRSADKRLARARAAVLRIARGEGAEGIAEADDE